MLPRQRFVEPNVLPGFGLALGTTITWLSLIVLFPLIALMARAGGLGVDGFLHVLQEPRVLAALRLSFSISFAAAFFNIFAGLLVAWVLTRYVFPLRRFLDAIVDLPFALPTAVGGIALAALYGKNGWVGSWLAKFGIDVAFTPLGIFVALVFIGLPFSVRTVQPILTDLDREIEEASATLGASRAQTWLRVVAPMLVPALISGFVLSFGRALGEYGSVIFIAGNLPFKSEIAPLLIVIKLEEFDYAGAAAIATITLFISFACLLVFNLLQAWSNRRLHHG